MQTIKIYFVDFWKGFNVCDNFFTNFLSSKYDVVVDSETPDYVFFSTYMVEIFKYEKAIKIYFTGENDVPDFNIADYAIGFHYIDFEDRYLRFPLYLFDHYAWNDLDSLAEKTITEKFCRRKFCNFVYSNRKVANPIRDKFFFELSKYKQVDSGGRLYNNIGGPVINKLDFVKDYKFTIAFENSQVNGYTTEKVIEPMMVNSIPIYWGNKFISKDFNVNSMLVVNDENDFPRVIEEIKFLDQNDKAYMKKLQEHWFIRKNEKEYWSNLLMNFLDNIFAQPIDQAKRCPNYGYAKNLYKEEYRASHLKGNLLWNKFWGGIDYIRKIGK